MNPPNCWVVRGPGFKSRRPNNLTAYKPVLVDGVREVGD